MNPTASQPLDTRLMADIIRALTIGAGVSDRRRKSVGLSVPLVVETAAVLARRTGGA